MSHGSESRFNFVYTGFTVNPGCCQGLKMLDKATYCRRVSRDCGGVIMYRLSVQTQNFTSRQVRVVLSHWQEPSVIILSVCSGDTCCIKNQNCPKPLPKFSLGGSRDCHIWCMDISPIFTILKSLVLQNLTKVSTNWLICCQHAVDVLHTCCWCITNVLQMCC